MEYIPARHAAKVGLQCIARVTEVAVSFVTLELDLTRVAPGRSPFLEAVLEFDRTVDPDKARKLRLGDQVAVVLIDVAETSSGSAWVQASLPAYPAWLAWNGETVRQLARHIRGSGETNLLPVLADALEEAGCSDTAILEHCRGTPDGERSWVVELLATQQ